MKRQKNKAETMIVKTMKIVLTFIMMSKSTVNTGKFDYIKPSISQFNMGYLYSSHTVLEI